MNKRGQFYLVAALIIILIFLGLTSISFNINSSEKDNKANNLVRQINFEVSQIIDNAVILSLNDSETISRINQTIYLYAQDNPDTDFALVYGTTDQINLSSAFVEYLSFNNINQRVLKTPVISTAMGNLYITLEENDTYSFNINSGKNFFLIAKVWRNNERIVATNQ